MFHLQGSTSSLISMTTAKASKVHSRILHHFSAIISVVHLMAFISALNKDSHLQFWAASSKILPSIFQQMTTISVLPSLKDASVFIFKLHRITLFRALPLLLKPLFPTFHPLFSQSQKLPHPFFFQNQIIFCRNVLA